MVSIEAPKFSGIQILSATGNQKSRKASLEFLLTDKHRKLSPNPKVIGDHFTLMMEGLGPEAKLKAQYYWPGAGDTVEVALEKVAPLIHETSSSNHVWLGFTKNAAFNKVKPVVERFAKVVWDANL